MARQKQSEKNATGATVDLSTENLGLTKFSDTREAKILDIIPTGLPNIDFILGGGLPFGRMAEMYGKNSSGKSTIAILMSGMAQRMNVDVVWVDVEGTTEAQRLIECGVDPVKNLYHIRPDEPKAGTKPKPTDGKFTVEDVGSKVIEVIQASAKSGRRLIIIWDSVASTPPRAQLEGGMEEKQMGLQSKAITKFTTLVGQEITNSSTLFLAINQARDVIGGYTPSIESAGGNAFKHWATLRLEITKGSAIAEPHVNAFGKTENVNSSFEAGIKIKKSKVSTPNRKETFILNTDHGINLAENYFELASKPSKYGLLTRSGAFYQYVTENGEQLSMYKNDWIAFLESPEGQAVRSELVQRMYMITFPNWYAPLDNEAINIELNPDFTGLRARYEAKKNSETQPVVNAE